MDGGRPVWVTGKMARRRGHLLRAEADAILVGRGTVQADNPDLTCRLPGLAARSPIRVVLDSTLQMDAGARLVTTAHTTPVMIFCAAGQGPSQKAQQLKAQGVQVLEVPAGAPGLDLQIVLAQLAAKGVTRLMIEGGPVVARAFLNAGLVDEMVIFRGSAELGKAGMPALNGLSLDVFADEARWRLYGQQNFNGDQMSIYQSRTSLAMLEG